MGRERCAHYNENNLGRLTVDTHIKIDGQVKNDMNKCLRKQYYSNKNLTNYLSPLKSIHHGNK
jgi:hypothetical protein